MTKNVIHVHVYQLWDQEICVRMSAYTCKSINKSYNKKKLHNKEYIAISPTFSTYSTSWTFQNNVLDFLKTYIWAIQINSNQNIPEPLKIKKQRDTYRVFCRQIMSCILN